jgi:integrase
MHVNTRLGDVSAFLDAYLERYVKPAGLRSIDAIGSRIGILKRHLGHLPLQSLEEPDDINQFKTDSDYAEDVELATMHRVLETLRAAMNWGMAQTPPLFAKTPFHRFGVRLNQKAETSRDRRLSRDEEKRLLDTALGKMNTPDHQFVGPILHDRIIGALELCCRRGEMLLIQNSGSIGTPVRSASRARRRRTRRTDGSRSTRTDAWRRSSRGESISAPRGTCSHGERHVSAEHPDDMRDAQVAGLRNRTEARKGGCSMEPGAASTHRPALARPTSRRGVRLLTDGVDIRIIQLMLGHASIQQTQRYLSRRQRRLFCRWTARTDRIPRLAMTSRPVSWTTIYRESGEPAFVSVG